MTTHRRTLLLLGAVALGVLVALLVVRGVDRPGDGIAAGPDGLSVQRLHQALFDREPDEMALELWTAHYADGEDLEVLAEEWLRAEELATAFGAVPDDEFVDAAFETVLDRAPDEDERTRWSRALGSGTSRARLLVELSDSAEHKRATGRHTHGTRVLLIGDSLMDQTGPYAEERLRELGYRTLVDARPGSGLLASHRPVDWLAEMRRHVEAYDPQIVVVEFCCNHWPDRQPDDHPFRHLPAGTPEFYEAWAAAVDEAVAILTSRGARLAWVHTPPAAFPDMDALVRGLNEISAEAAERHGFARIDWAVAVSDGTFQLHWGGDPVRNPDGLHLEPAGARRTAVATVAGVMRLS